MTSEERKERERERRLSARQKYREGQKQEKQGRTSLFRGGCCGINSVKSRRADRVSETERDRAQEGWPAAGGTRGEQEREREREEEGGRGRE